MAGEAKNKASHVVEPNLFASPKAKLGIDPDNFCRPRRTFSVYSWSPKSLSVEIANRRCPRGSFLPDSNYLDNCCWWSTSQLGCIQAGVNCPCYFVFPSRFVNFEKHSQNKRPSSGCSVGLLISFSLAMFVWIDARLDVGLREWVALRHMAFVVLGLAGHCCSGVVSWRVSFQRLIT